MVTKKSLEKYASQKFFEAFGEPDDWPDWQAVMIYLEDNHNDLSESDVDAFIQMCVDEYKEMHWKVGMEMPKAWNGLVPKGEK